MPIHVFYIPFGYKGSTRELFLQAIEERRGPDYSKVLYIAPTAEKVNEAQRLFHDVTGTCVIPPTMMTLPQFSKRIFSLYENRKIASQALVPVILSSGFQRSLGHSCLIADFFHDIKQRYPREGIEEITGGMLSLFDRLGIPDEISSRTMEALTIMDRYAQVLEQNDAADENDVMAACPEILRTRKIRYDWLIIDGFIELTPSEEVLVKALIDDAENTLISIPCDKYYNLTINSYELFLNKYFIFERVFRSPSPDNISLAHHPYPGAEDEIEGIARSIKHLFITGAVTRLENVFVVFPQLPARSAMIARIFKKYGIPFALTAGMPLARAKPNLDLLALLDSVANDYPRLQFAQFLTSPYFKALSSSFREFIPSLCIAAGFSRGKNEWLNLVKAGIAHSRGERFSSAALQTLSKDLSRIFRKLGHLESISRNASFSDFSEAVLKLLHDFVFDNGESQSSGKNGEIISILNDLSFVDRFTRSKPSSLDTFREALRHCLLNSPMPEMDSPGVRIMRFMDASGLEPEYLFFGGLKDGDFPSKPDIDHLMPDSVRTGLGLANMEKSLILQKFQFMRLLSTAKAYYLSYSVMEGDRLFLPSSFLSWNTAMTRTINGVFSREEELIGKGSSPGRPIISDILRTSKRIIRKMFGEKSSIRVTDIDAYRSCPRKFFIERVLELKPLEIAQFEMEALTLGTVVHEIMHHLLSEPYGDLDSLTLKASTKIDSILSEKPLEDFWKKVLKETFLSILPHIYALEVRIRAEGFTFMGAEVPVAGELLKGVTLKGRIDRIDRKTDQGGKPPKRLPEGKTANAALSDDSTSFELIDYKTGTVQFSGSQILAQGANLQLLLYAHLMRLQGMHVERVGIYSVKDTSISWIPHRRDRKQGRTLEDYLAAARQFLEETVHGMRNGYFPGNPLNDHLCRNCHERPYCPYIQRAAV